MRTTACLPLALLTQTALSGLVNTRNDKRSLPRCAPATTSIYGMCGYGPSGPVPTFAGAHFSNAGAVIRNSQQL